VVSIVDGNPKTKSRKILVFSLVCVIVYFLSILSSFLLFIFEDTSKNHNIFIIKSYMRVLFGGLFPTKFSNKASAIKTNDQQNFEKP